MGRKPLSDIAKSDRPLRIRLTDYEREQLDKAAGATDQNTSTWARDVLLKAAERQLAVRKRKRS